jgi:hypothetical protein
MHLISLENKIQLLRRKYIGLTDLLFVSLYLNGDIILMDGFPYLVSISSKLATGDILLHNNT